MARAEPAAGRVRAGVVAVAAAMAVVLYAVPLALADRIDPRMSLLALMVVDAVAVAALARTRASLGACAALAVLLAASAAGRAAGAFALPSIATFGALSAGFAWTLRAGATPLVTAVAREAHGPALGDRFERYTRGLTAAWALGFGALAATSAALAAWADFATWTLFVNLLSWPIIAAGFVVEWAVRRIAWADLPSTTPARTVAAVLRYATTAASPADGSTRAADAARLR